MDITPSMAYGCIDLLETLSSNSDYNRANVQHIDLTSVRSLEVLNILIKLGWIRIGKFESFDVSDRGREICEISSTIEKTREFLLDFVDLDRPTWSQLIPYGRLPALQHAPEEVRQIFRECGLAIGTEYDVISFWNTLAERVRGRMSENLERIGIDGELLTFEYEQIRTEKLPRWVAIEDSRLGYDLLSVVSKDDSSLLRIEVKTSIRSIEDAGFYITENEWSKVCDIGDHKFYLWWLYNGEKRLAILDSDTVQEHIPHNRGEGRWKDVKVPFRIFEDMFHYPKI